MSRQGMHACMNEEAARGLRESPVHCMHITITFAAWQRFIAWVADEADTAVFAASDCSCTRGRRGIGPQRRLPASRIFYKNESEWVAALCSRGLLHRIACWCLSGTQAHPLFSEADWGAGVLTGPCPCDNAQPGIVAKEHSCPGVGGPRWRITCRETGSVMSAATKSVTGPHHWP